MRKRQKEMNKQFSKQEYCLYPTALRTTKTLVLTVLSAIGLNIEYENYKDD